MSPRCSSIRNGRTAISATRTTACAPTRSSPAGTSPRSTTAASARQPTFYRLATGTPGQPFVFQPRYDRIWQAGGTVSKDLGEMVLRGEAVYASGQGYSVTDLAVPQGVVQRSTLDYIVSVEFPLPGDTRLNLQGFQRAYLRRRRGRPRDQERRIRRERLSLDQADRRRSSRRSCGSRTSRTRAA